MLINLKLEMWKRNITGKKLAAHVGMRPETFSDKIHGRSDFTRTEMFAIWNAFFSDLDMAFLFEDEK